MVQTARLNCQAMEKVIFCTSSREIAICQLKICMFLKLNQHLQVEPTSRLQIKLSLFCEKISMYTSIRRIIVSSFHENNTWITEMNE